MMAFALNFPLFLIVACLLYAVASTLIGGKAARIVSLALAGLSTLCNVRLLCYTAAQKVNFLYTMGHFPHPWGNELKIGSLEALLSTAFSIVLFLILVAGTPDIKSGNRRYYYVMADLVLVALLVLVYTNDLFTGYVFIEICTLASAGLLFIRDNGESILAAVRYMIFSLIGSGLFLFGVIFLHQITGQLLMPELKTAVSALWASGSYRIPLTTSICLITLGLAIKSGLFPFHLWMADTYGAAISPSSGILSGLVSKGYIAFLIKVIFDVFGTDVFYASGMPSVLAVLGACGIVFGSISALRENVLSRMLAYSSAAQIGYVYLGIGLGAEVGMLAAVYHILAHALTKPALFLATTPLIAAAGNKTHFHYLQGTGYSCRTASALFSFEAFSMIGLPFTMGFISKYLIGAAAFSHPLTLTVPVLLVLVLSTILNTLYFARTVIRLFTKPEDPLPCPEAARRSIRCTPVIVLAALNIVLGVFARPVISFLRDALARF